MTTISPEQVIAAFDDCLDFIYGRSRGRDYISKEDIKYATEWIEEGLTIHVACFVFYHRMSAMHELWVKQLDPNDNKHIPATLKFFNEAIMDGISRWKRGGEGIAVWEQSESQWKARLNGFYSKNLWNTDLWGPRPGESECRVPPRLLTEVKALAENKKKDRIK